MSRSALAIAILCVAMACGPALADCRGCRDMVLYAQTSQGPLVIHGRISKRLCGITGPGEFTPALGPKITFTAKIQCTD